jgi:hypothetical protein
MIINLSIPAFATKVNQEETKNTNSYSVSNYRKINYNHIFDYMKKMGAKVETELQKNEYNSNGERHLKITWKAVNGADAYQIEIADNPYFKNSETKRRVPRQGNYYNFVIDENVDATFYIRIRPIFVIENYNEEYITIYGRWTNLVARALI